MKTPTRTFYKVYFTFCLLLSSSAFADAILDQANHCASGYQGACHGLITLCNQGNDMACSRIAIELFYRRFDYMGAEKYVKIGCQMGGKQSCELHKAFPEELKKACQTQKLGACDALNFRGGK